MRLQNPSGTATTADPTLDLLRKAVRGDRVALDGLLILHAPQVLAYINHHLPPQVAAVCSSKDVLQDVCIEACRRIHEFESDHVESLLPWLLTMARHHMIGMLRKAKAQKRGGEWRELTAGSDSSGEVIPLLEGLAVFYRTPSVSAMSHETILAVQRAIDRLPPDHREAVRLRHIEGLAAKDAAVRMNRTEGAFHVLCHRALTRLREDLGARSRFG
jgi:RNA polymerase sigma-70 factor, ECF subfamily